MTIIRSHRQVERWVRLCKVSLQSDRTLPSSLAAPVILARRSLPLARSLACLAAAAAFRSSGVDMLGLKG